MELREIVGDFVKEYKFVILAFIIGLVLGHVTTLV